MSTLLNGLKKVSFGSKNDEKSTKSESPPPPEVNTTNVDTNGETANVTPVSPTGSVDYWNGTARIGSLTESQRTALYTFWTSLLGEHVPAGHHLRPQLIASIQDGVPDSFILRFLRARKFDVDLAVDALVKTLSWRDDKTGGNVDEIIEKGDSDLDPGLFNGRAVFVGYDTTNHIVSYHSAAHHVRGVYAEQALHKLTIYMMETGRLFLKRNTKEEVTLLFDMTKFGMANMDNSLVKFMVRCMTDHYPESLGRCLVLEAPWVFSSVWKVIKSWLDPVVAAKVRFIKINELEEYVSRKCWPSDLAEYYIRNVEKGEKRKERDFVEAEEPVEDSEQADVSTGNADSPSKQNLTASPSHSSIAGKGAHLKSGFKKMRKSVKSKKDKANADAEDSDTTEASLTPTQLSTKDKSTSHLDLHLPEDHFEFKYTPPTPEFIHAWFTPERTKRVKELKGELVEAGERFLNITYTWANLAKQEGKQDEEVTERRNEARDIMLKIYWAYDNERRFPTAWHRCGVIKGDQVQFPRLPNVEPLEDTATTQIAEEISSEAKSGAENAESDPMGVKS